MGIVTGNFKFPLFVFCKQPAEKVVRKGRALCLEASPRPLFPLSASKQSRPSSAWWPLLLPGEQAQEGAVWRNEFPGWVPQLYT